MDLSEGKGKGTSASNPCGTDSGEMQQESNKKMSDMLWRPWDSLPPELLELIFNHCPLHDKLMIQSVCKSWNKVTASPFVWQKIDMLEWSKNRDPATLNRMLLRLFNNLCSGLGPPKRLLIHGVSDLTFPLITASAENLTTLKIPWSVISNEMVIQEATKLSSLRFLDLSYCRHIGAPAMRAVGRHCRLLTGFRRIVHKNVRLGDYDDEAYAIAATMRQLRSLELHYLNFSSQLCVC
ncbi:F-box domain containing protein [Trema orientale]|uniref:F-box domain containing protein n=1 Tax=Trema orientale TaxID=63057 RepID=A0A2P5CGR1_TREOI|nr:F-box domain containing protein [Trema orientale]